MGKGVGVMLRTAKEVEAAVGANPFTDAPGNRVQVFFMNEAPPEGLLETARNMDHERIAAGAFARSMSRTGKRVSGVHACASRLPKPGPRAT